MTTIYVIARNENVTYGHGDYGTHDVLVRQGPYDSGDPHPAFRALEAAEKYLEDNGLVYCKPVAVELQDA